MEKPKPSKNKVFRLIQTYCTSKCKTEKKYVFTCRHNKNKTISCNAKHCPNMR